MVEVRIAKTADAAGILQIYAPHILNRSTTFETEVPSLEAFEARILNYMKKHPWIVCLIDGKVSGYAYGSVFKEREAYQWSCECSVYIKDRYKGMGIGKELYAILLPMLKMQGIRNVYAGVTLPNEASIHLHELFGFRQFAVYENVGYKQNGWKNVGWWKLQINDYNLNPSPPIPFDQLDPELYNEILRRASFIIQSRFSG